MTQIAPLTDRGVLVLHGVDRVTFLNGLISQDVTKVTTEQPLYGCLLTPQGKYFADFFIIMRDDAIMLDVPLVRKDAVLQRLNMFVLRSKVTIADVSSDHKIYAVWNGTIANGYADPRYSGLGQRVISTSILDTNTILDVYHTWRLQHGVADVTDFEIERTALLEANLDQLHGIAWEKGCYMGQELTARTHYRGLIKKRLLPFQFDGDAPVYDTPIMIGNDTIGHTRSTSNGYGLALMKMEFADAAWGGSATVNGMDITILKPEWFELKVA